MGETWVLESFLTLDFVLNACWKDDVQKFVCKDVVLHLAEFPENNNFSEQFPYIIRLLPNLNHFNRHFLASQSVFSIKHDAEAASAQFTFDFVLFDETTKNLIVLIVQISHVVCVSWLHW